MGLSAAILAAGMGRRLGLDGLDSPKGLMHVGKEPLVHRSLRLLLDAGVDEISIVVGYKSHMYLHLVDLFPSVRILYNEDYEHSGSARSFAIAAESADSDLLVLDSDIIFSAAAVPFLLGCDQPNSLLVSGFTQAGDEVWVFGDSGRVTKIDKNSSPSRHPVGEFVGISRISSEMLEAMAEFVWRDPSRQLLEYESVISGFCRKFQVNICQFRNLVWGEIDTTEQLARVEREILPRLNLAE